MAMMISRVHCIAVDLLERLSSCWIRGMPYPETLQSEDLIVRPLSSEEDLRVIEDIHNLGFTKNEKKSEECDIV